MNLRGVRQKEEFGASGIVAEKGGRKAVMVRSEKSPACPLVLSNFCSTNSLTTSLLLTDLIDSLICPLVNLESLKDSVSVRGVP